MKRLLLIDDDPEFGDALAAALKDEDIDVLYAPDAAKGVEFVLTRAPDVVLLDQHLPDRLGSVAVNDMRALGFAGCVLLVSGSPDVAELVSVTGADGYIIKPVNLSALIELVHQTGERTLG